METKIVKNIHDRRNIYFVAEHSGEITPKMAKDAQGNLGYMVAGYGFDNFQTGQTPEGNSVATWRCSSSCD